MKPEASPRSLGEILVANSEPDDAMKSPALGFLELLDRENALQQRRERDAEYLGTLSASESGGSSRTISLMFDITASVNPLPLRFDGRRRSPAGAYR